MITFQCPQCAKSYTVGDKLAGRKAKCKACGASVVVPQPKTQDTLEGDVASWLGGDEADPLAPETTNRKPPMRTRRLMADAKSMAAAFRKFPLIQIQQRQGDPPDRYQIAYKVRGLVRGPEGTPIYRDEHVVEIQLTSNYPRQSPKCRVLTPIFHPNIEPTAICVGDHWTAGERLVELVIRIGEMITYQAYNIKSPLDGDAAMWADQNPQHLPVDRRDLRPPDLD